MIRTLLSPSYHDPCQCYRDSLSFSFQVGPQAARGCWLGPGEWLPVVGCRLLGRCRSAAASPRGCRPGFKLEGCGDLPVEHHWPQHPSGGSGRWPGPGGGECHLAVINVISPSVRAASRSSKIEPQQWGPLFPGTTDEASFLPVVCSNTKSWKVQFGSSSQRLS